MTDEPRINIPDMCKMHQSLLVHQVGVPESGPWRSLIIMAQIALFQGATADPTFYERLGGDLGRIGEIGCLACFKPDRFGEIVEAVKSTDAGAIKRLGESWLRK